jgi:hypothetical protein
MRSFTPTTGLLKRSIPVLLAFVAVILAPGRASGQDDYVQEKPYQLKYRTYETRDLRVFYFFREQEYVIEHLSRCFENAFHYHQKFFGYTPSGEVTVYFNDDDDYGYAGTTVIPNNWITLGIEPFEYVYDTCPTNERMNWVMNHELVHVTASDQATGWDSRFRKLFFGKVHPVAEDPVSIFYAYLTTPRLYAPRWYHEGIAVFMETWMAGGIGRSLTGYDEMTFRAMVLDSTEFYTVVGLESEGTAKDFQIGQMSYLYGTRFFSYLALTEGPGSVIEWVRRNEGSGAYFSRQFQKVYGASIYEKWNEWIEFEKKWQTTNIVDSIRQYPVTPARPLCERALGSVSREFFDAGTRTLYTAVNYPGEFSHIAAIDIDSGRMRKICEIETPALYYVTSLAYDPESGTLFFTTDNSRGWRDLNSVDIATGKTKVLCRNNRTGDLVYNRADSTIWGMRHDNGFTSIVMFTPPYSDGYELIKLRYGIDMFDIDISPDGRYLTGTMTDISGRQRLIRMETARLIMGDGTWELIHEFPDNNAANFVHSPDGRYLYGTSYVTGTSNIFRFDLEQWKLEALSNFEVGGFRPLPVSDDSLIAFLYTSGGFEPAMTPVRPIEDIAVVRYLGQAVVLDHPEVKDWKLSSPREIEIDSLKTYEGEYSPARSLRVTSLYPVVEGYKDYGTIGLRFNMMDPVGINALDMAVSYTPVTGLPENERAHFRFRYSRGRWAATGYYNRADFYDLFGPTKVSRKGHSLALDYVYGFVVDRPKKLGLKVRAAAYGNLEYLPDYQNIQATIKDFYTLEGSLDYSHVRRTIGGIQAEKGMTFSLNEYSSLINGDLYPLLWGTLDLGFLLPWEHSSVWLRSSGGFSLGDRKESNSYFYFGGFGNNWVDHQVVDRYREFYAFPGVELNEIGGTNFLKGTIEWALPPLRFSSLGWPSLYANWASLTFFGSAIATNIDPDYEGVEVADAGAQLNFRVVFFSSLQTTFSAGYAFAFEEGYAPREELMLSLKILR